MQTSNLEVSKKRNHEEEEKQPEHLECPRCFSSNTKFCYYNNYNKSQPRHFCKGCKRHWTKGGTLRNVPLGGGRKNKRQKLSNSASNKNHTTAPMSSSDPLIIFSQQVDNNNGTNNHLMGNNTSFLGGDHGMFFLPTSQDQNNQFSCSEVGNFGSNLPSFAPKNHSLDAYGYTHMPDSSLESTITTTMPMDGCNNLSQKPFQDSFASGSMDLSSLWDWNEISSLVSADLNVPWDDSDIKF